ncbi:alpha/beta hydrolase [Streptomyces sp. NBC_00237]|uniref:alpha/beta fold hydrolase n=1 Tax=Streptomyces sp. NBC_00237 TaxID=2975687 RepID=UPI002257CC01|nr:alpha/beta hydrolase [Streptomyces sp. NBC_00237]MCX5204227.1 alpha/beta hydrolase [Streptomyces sp. NBC_00237]
MNTTPLHLRDHGGAGPALLLLHGAGRSHADWDAVVPHLLPRHRVLAVDLPGHGRSAAPADRWSFEGAARALDGILTAHDAVPVGHSLGGLVAAYLAATRPGTPAAVDLDGFWWGAPERYEAGARVREVMYAAAGGVMPAGFVEQQAAYAEQFGIPCERAERAARAAVRELPDGRWQTLPERDTALAMYAAMDAFDLFAAFREAACPLLLVRGERAQPASPPGMEWFDAFLGEYGEGLSSDLASLRADRPDTVTVAGVDTTHAMLLEEPEAVAALVAGFVGG